MSREHPLGYCEKKLYDISKEVKLLQARLRFLALEEENGQIAKRRARNCQAPIARLPNEIISNILLYSMMGLRALLWRSPILAVSHHWRACALSEPIIWQHIRIVEDTQKEELARSRNAPLFVFYIALQENDKSSQENFAMMQSLIAPHVGRIHKLGYTFAFPPSFFFPLSMTSSSLEVLSVHWQGTALSVPAPHVFGDGAPSGLRELTLIVLDRTSAQVVLNDFDASALVTLHIGTAFTIPSIWSTLSRSRLLENLGWFMNDITGSEDVDVRPPDLSRLGFPPITLKHLQSLYIAGPKSPSILALLDASSLERLNITAFPANWLQHLIPEIIRRDQLQRLALGHIGALRANQLRDIFTALPQLEYFVYDTWTAESIPALGILTPPATVQSRRGVGTWCLPRLRVLRIGDILPALSAAPGNPAHIEFLRAMNEYVRPLVLRCRMYASQPLTVVLKHPEMLNGFLGIEDIECTSFYTWPVK